MDEWIQRRFFGARRFDEFALVAELLIIADDLQEVFDRIKFKQPPTQNEEEIPQFNEEKLIEEILENSTTTQEEKKQMLRAVDRFNNLLESATNLLFFGKFKPTSLI